MTPAEAIARGRVRALGSRIAQAFTPNPEGAIFRGSFFCGLGCALMGASMVVTRESVAWSAALFAVASLNLWVAWTERPRRRRAKGSA